MRKDDVPEDLSGLAFDFFYWFSRFEFALKENGYLKSHKPGERAEPGWQEFSDKWASKYVPSAEATALLDEPPERQIVGVADNLDWVPIGLADCKSELAKVVRLVAAVRNNLFHGGKHGGAGWDNPSRTKELLIASKAVLDQFAQMASLQADYTQYY